MSEADKIKIALYKKIFKEIKQNYIAVPELSLSSAIADMVVVNGDIHIYEIKSKVDSLSRLKNQLDRYKKCANKITILADEKFIPKLLNYPNMDNVGIMSINNRMQIKTIKEAISVQMSAENYMAYWTATEIKESLRGFNGHSKMSIGDARKRLFSILNNEEIKKVTLYKIKENYGYEFLERKKLIKNKQYKESLQSRFINMASNHTIPLMMLPAYLFKDFDLS